MIKRLTSICILGVSLFLGSCALDKEHLTNEFDPVLKTTDDYSSIVVSSVSGLPIEANFDELLRVYVLEEGAIWNESYVPINGEYDYKEGRIHFTPKYPFLEDTRYYARFELVSISEEESELVRGYSFTITGDKTPVTYVEDVYPSTDYIPRNLLKFYIQFSSSMTEGEMLDNIRILDEEGEIVEHAFLEIPQELWDVDRQRLTILFDPGRIKRGMELLDEVGAPFEIGKTYTLQIDKNWKDGEHRELVSAYLKEFTIVEDDRTKLSEREWDIVTPKSETKEAFELHFNESLDYALLNRAIIIRNDQRDQVSGTIILTENESKWKFLPANAWEEGDYSITIETLLEDLAGNNLISVFDVDLENEEEVVNRMESKEFVEFLFEIQ